uniref:Uncharacterized protein n=1 Tax=Aegilops tauschii subsp. strangulata TaxID=200361 RepID=A0A453J5Y6_AEGTS
RPADSSSLPAHSHGHHNLIPPRAPVPDRQEAH